MSPGTAPPPHPPANPPISGRPSPSRRAEGQPAQPTITRTVKQIAQLSPTQRPRLQIMIRIHEPIPDPRSAPVSMGNKDQFDLPELLQAATKRFNPWKRRINRRLGDKPGRFTSRKAN